MINLIIKGKPLAKKRPRFVRRGKFVSAYNDQETEEGRFLWEVTQQHKEPPVEGPIILSCHFRMPIPKSTSKKRQKLMLNNEIQHTKRPDLDNLVKFVKDCLNGICWNDDSQVWHLTASKVYGIEPLTLINIQPDRP